MYTYTHSQGEAESYALKYAKESKGTVEASVAKPGLIDAPGRSSFVGGIAKTIMCTVIGLPRLENKQISAALVDQAVNGLEMETMHNEDLIRIGSKALEGQKSSE